MTMPFVIECTRPVDATTRRALREAHANLASAIEGFVAHQQGPWESVRLIPCAAGTPLGRNLEQLCFLLDEAEQPAEDEARFERFAQRCRDLAKRMLKKEA